MKTMKDKIEKLKILSLAYDLADDNEIENDLDCVPVEYRELYNSDIKEYSGLSKDEVVRQIINIIDSL